MCDRDGARQASGLVRVRGKDAGSSRRRCETRQSSVQRVDREEVRDRWRQRERLSVIERKRKPEVKSDKERRVPEPI